MFEVCGCVVGAKGRSERVLTNRLCLVQYIKTTQAERIVFDIKVIQAVAQEVVRAHKSETEHFGVSRDWADKFKKRHGFGLRRGRKSHCHVFLGGLDPGQAPLKTLLLMLRFT